MPDRNTCLDNLVLQPTPYISLTSRLINLIFLEKSPISYLGFIGLKTKTYVGKTTKYIFPWTRDSQCQDSSESLVENTPDAPKFISPICLPKPKSLGFF